MPNSDPQQLPVSENARNLQEEDIVFKYNRIYRHNIMRINYTTYDVRRAQDTINTNTSKRDILVLSCESDSDSAMPFLYARVLGIFHVNAIRIGGSKPDYNPVRLDFLWVRWFETLSPGSWEKHELERIAFPPMADEEAFGFLDPSSVVRACHLSPSFAQGPRYSDGQGLSTCARDSDDYCQYFVGR